MYLKNYSNQKLENKSHVFYHNRYLTLSVINSLTQNNYSGHFEAPAPNIRVYENPIRNKCSDDVYSIITNSSVSEANL